MSRAALTAEEKVQLRESWPSLACAYCGYLHVLEPCPKIRSIERTFSTDGQRVTHEAVVFWPPGKWLPTAKSISIDDVFGDDKVLPKRQAAG